MLFSESFQCSIVQRSGQEITDLGHCCEQKKFLVPVARQCDYRARDQVRDPRWMPSWTWLRSICICPHLYLWARPLHLKMTCLLDLFPVLSSTNGVYPWCRAEGESFPHLCLNGLVSIQPGARQASRAAFGSWLSDDLLVTSGVMGQKMGSPLLGTWRYPSSSPFSAGKEPACFCLFVFWRGFQLGLQMNLFQRCCLSGWILWIIEL